MSWILFSDSSTSVELFPAKDHKVDIKKDRSEYRSMSGANYFYNWGNYRSWNFKLEFVDSADISQINSWWYSDAKLLLKESTDTQVFSVQIVGEKEPVTKFIRPQRELLRGAISLETY